MKHRQYIYIIFLTIIFIISSASVTSMLNVTQGNVLTENYTFNEIHRLDNNLFTVCSDGGCDLSRVNATVLTLLINNNFTNRQDWFYMDSKTSGFLGKLHSITNFPSKNLYVSGSGDWYYINYKVILGTGGGANTCLGEVYVWDSINSVWTLINSISTGFCGSASSGTITFYPITATTTNLRSIFNNNSLFYTQPINGITSNVGFKLNSSTKLQSFSFGDSLIDIHNGDANSNFYTATGGFNYFGQKIYTFNDIGGIIGFVDQKSTSVDISDDYYYVIDLNSDAIIRGMITNLIQNISGTSVQDTSTNCLTQFTGFTNKFYDVECESLNDCVFAGSRDNKPMIMLYNGTVCSVPNITGLSPILQNNGTFIDVYYDKDNDSYYVTGTNITLRFGVAPQPINILNLSNITSYPNPLCMDNNYLCNNTFKYDDGENIYFYCNIDDEIFCNQGCINNVIDESTQQNYVSTTNNCQVFFSNQSYKTLSCGIYSGSQYASWLISWLPYVPQCSQDTNTFQISSATCNNSDINAIVNANPTHLFTSAGVCSQSTSCSNECNILGQNYCDSSTSFVTCGQFDSDPCLDLSPPNGCLPGYICSINQCILNNQTGNFTITPSAFQFNPYSVSDSATTYTLDATLRRLNVATNNVVHIQKFAVSGSGVSYSAIQCNYAETTVTDDNTLLSSTNSTTSTKTVAPLNTASVIRFNNTLNNTQNSSDVSNYTIEFLSSLDVPFAKFYILRTPVNKSLCMYKSNSTVVDSQLMFCDFSVNSYDDFQSLSWEMEFDYNAKSYSTLFTVNRVQSSKKYTRGISFDNVGLTDFSKVSLTGFTNSLTTIDTFKTFNVPQFTGMSLTAYNDYNQYLCSYSTTGCRDVRLYNSPEQFGVYDNYKDYEICVNTLTSTIPPSTGFGESDFIASLFGTNLSTGTKLFYTIMVLFVSAILMLIFGFGFGMSGTMVGVLTSIIVVAELVLFALIGFIPVWVIILIAIIASGIVAIGFKKVVVQ